MTNSSIKCEILLSIQDKHIEYFLDTGSTITDYVHINWQGPELITYNKDMPLPVEIINDINNYLNVVSQ